MSISVSLSHVFSIFGLGLKTTQRWAGLKEGNTSMIMIALAYGNQMHPYDMQNTEKEYKDKKVGNGLFVFMMTELESDSEIDCQISLIRPALQFS